MKQQLTKYPNMKLVIDGLRQRRPGHLADRAAGPALGLPEPQGHHLAHHGRHLDRGAVPVDPPGRRQAGHPDRARPAVADEASTSRTAPSSPSSCGTRRNLGYLAGYAAASLASGSASSQAGATFKAGTLGRLQGARRPPATPARRSCSARRRCSTSPTSTSSTSDRADPVGAGRHRPGSRLKPRGRPMARYCFLLQVRPELLDEYRAAARGGVAGHAARAARHRLAQLLDLRPARRPARRLRRGRRPGRSASGDGRNRGQRPLAGRDEPVLRRPRRPRPGRGVPAARRDLQPRGPARRSSPKGSRHDSTRRDAGQHPDPGPRSRRGARRSAWSPAASVPTGRSSPTCCRSCSARRAGSPSGCRRWTATSSTSGSSPTPRTAPAPPSSCGWPAAT